MVDPQEELPSYEEATASGQGSNTSPNSTQSQGQSSQGQSSYHSALSALSALDQPALIQAAQEELLGTLGNNNDSNGSDTVRDRQVRIRHRLNNNYKTA